jgi:hypothetical protein
MRDAESVRPGVAIAPLRSRKLPATQRHFGDGQPCQ